MLNVFFSYSHKDESVRDELEIHLAMLKRQGVIEAWHDRRIQPGDVLDRAIGENLERADIVLLLVSPYFLASNYCYDVEMARAMERHKAGECRVIPVIVDPCDWHSGPFGKLMAVPADGKPISKYPNQHDAFLEIVNAIRGVAASKGGAAAKPVFAVPSGTPVTEERRSSNLRIKREFTDHDKDSFLEETFEYIANYFEGSLAELQTRNQGITWKFRRLNANHFTAAIYRNGKSASQCGIRINQGGVTSSRQIAFCYEPDSTNSMHEWVGVEHDGHCMFFKSAGFTHVLSDQRNKGQLSREGAAELFWAMLMDPLQR